MTTSSKTRRRPGPAKGTPRAKRLPRAEREEQILGIAEEIFARQGYSVTTMEEIAEAAGITKPVIYDYFESKEGLLTAGIARAREALRTSTVEVWQAMPEDSSLREMFYVGVRAFFTFIDDHATSFQLIQQEGALATHAHQGVEDIRGEQSRVIAESIAAALPDADPLLLAGYAESVIGACERVAIWRINHPGVTAEQATDIVFATVWQGLDSLMTPARV
ncbi:MAG: TetR/AcrR family transcriptional regulator [Micrococcales bacterium]|nr:TetR/AcrR family transcriptional regulator [Micrococcales bacterium]